MQPFNLFMLYILVFVSLITVTLSCGRRLNIIAKSNQLVAWRMASALKMNGF